MGKGYIYLQNMYFIVYHIRFVDQRSEAHGAVPYFQHELPSWTAKPWSLSDKPRGTAGRHFPSTVDDTTTFTSESPRKEE